MFKNKQFLLSRVLFAFLPYTTLPHASYQSKCSNGSRL